MSMYRPHKRVQLDCAAAGPSLTRQEFAKECDINEIMRRYAKTGVISHTSPRAPQYLDLGDGVPDLITAMNTLIAGEQAFMSLPAVVRRDFDNDPKAFVAFAAEAKNLPKLREWGLAPPEKAPDAPMRVEVVNPPPPPPVVS